MLTGTTIAFEVESSDTINNVKAASKRRPRIREGKFRLNLHEIEYLTYSGILASMLARNLRTEISRGRPYNSFPPHAPPQTTATNE